MSLRILGDDPGYALLEFNRAFESPTLEISVRSYIAHPDEHLGLRGTWQKRPHYFSATRQSGTANSTRYRIGPEIVNYMLDADSCEIATADRSIVEVADWIEPVPQPLKSSGMGSIYVEPGPKPRESGTAKSEPVTEPPNNPEPIAEKDNDDKKLSPPPLPFSQPVLIGAAVGVVALVGLIFLTSLKCSLLGFGCPAPLDTGLPTAMSCAEGKLAGDPCGVKACFETYISKTGSEAMAPEARELIGQGETACQKTTSEATAADQAKACAMVEKSHDNICGVRAKCVATYLTAYADGPHRTELEDLAHQADSDCAAKERDREAAEKELETADAARKCAAEKNRARNYCLIEAGCLTDYRDHFPNGKSLAELNAIGATARAACQQAERDRLEADRLKRQQDEDAARAKREAEAKAFEDANLCAKTSACLADACFSEYKRLYPDGVHVSDASQVLADAANTCAHPPTQTSSIPEGIYTGRALSGCGSAGQFGIDVSISGGRITWQHDMPPADGVPPIHYQWGGTIDADGTIRASVGNSSSYSATGTFSDTAREIQLHYPNCADPIMLKIGNRIH